MRGLLPCAMLASAARAFVRSARHPAPVARAAVRAMSQKSDSYEMEGTLTKIGENQEFESGFNKVEFVITTDSMFPQEIKFVSRAASLSPFGSLSVRSVGRARVPTDPRGPRTLFLRRTSTRKRSTSSTASARSRKSRSAKPRLLVSSNPSVATPLARPPQVFFNIRGNEWQGRHFINLQCWRLEEAAGGGGDFYYEPPAAAAAEGEVASSSSASSAGGAFDAPFAAYSDDAPAAPTEPKKDGDIPF